MRNQLEYLVPIGTDLRHSRPQRTAESTVEPTIAKLHQAIRLEPKFVSPTAGAGASSGAHEVSLKLISIVRGLSYASGVAQARKLAIW